MEYILVGYLIINILTLDGFNLLTLYDFESPSIGIYRSVYTVVVYFILCVTSLQL